jgi:hypothetical protein
MCDTSGGGGGTRAPTLFYWKYRGVHIGKKCFPGGVYILLSFKQKNIKRGREKRGGEGKKRENKKR